MMQGHKIRVLVVDNNEVVRDDFADLLRGWGYEPVVVLDDGTGLVERARVVAAEDRCLLALIDMRLIEDRDLSDDSGLQLAKKLPHTRSIIITGYDTTAAQRRATKEFGVASFIGKGEEPSVLEAELDRLAQELCLKEDGSKVQWTGGLSSAGVRDEMFSGQAGIPGDVADILVCQLFKGKSVRLTRITADGETPSPTNASPSISTSLRRESRVFVAKIAGESALQVVKLARTEKIEREQQHFEQFVRNGTPSVRRPELTGVRLHWDMGAIAYRMVSFARLAEGRDKIFTRVYRATADVKAIVAPLADFFAYAAWGNWYRSAKELEGSLVEEYDRSWRGALARKRETWSKEPETRHFGGLPVELPNPTRWFADHYRRCESLHGLRQAVTHGDLHGDNLFVDGQHAWPIDFERTGYGPILRDFVELIQDLTTRIAQFHTDELPLVYELAVALCAPDQPDQPMRATRRILDHPEARKLFLVVQALLELAAERAACDDRRELLWGLLCNHLFVATKLPDEGPRWLRTMVFAGVICARLKKWDAPTWLPTGGPPLDWADPLPPAPLAKGAEPIVTPAAPFPHGYALVVGVGAISRHPELQEPVTVNDARALAAVLSDPTRCGYDPEQIHLLHDERATGKAILAGLERLAQAARADDQTTVVVYFSGHGLHFPDGRFALVPSDADLSRPEETLLWGETCAAAIAAIPARRLLVCIDACHAQGIGAKDVGLALGAGLAKSAPPTSLLGRLAQGQGRAVLSACQEHERSYYLPGEQLSFFTRSLVEALTGAASRPGEREVTLSDLQHHLSEAVPRVAQQAYGVEQHPWYELSGDDWPVALLQGDKGVLVQTGEGLIAPPQAVSTAALPSSVEIRARLRTLSSSGLQAWLQDNVAELALEASPRMTNEDVINLVVERCQRRPAELHRLAPLLP